MNFDLDEDQALFRATVERFCGSFDIVARHRARALPGGVDRARWKELAELGLIAVAAPESGGGLGGSILDCVVVAQAMGRGLAADPWLECGFVPARLLDGANLGAVIAGTGIAALAFAEPRGRYSLEPRETMAREARGGLVLTGEKTFVAGGGAAGVFVVTAQAADGPALFAVPRDASGVSVRSYAVTDGGHAAVLTLRDVPLTGGHRVADGAARFEAMVADARLMASAEMVGLARRLFDDTLAYVKTREQFGQPLGRFQAIQHRLVDAYALLEQAQSALWRAALDEGAARRRESAGVKAFIAERALAIGHEAVQLHGGMGMTDELAIGHALKRVVLLSRLFGDAQAGFSDYAMAA